MGSARPAVHAHAAQPGAADPGLVSQSTISTIPGGQLNIQSLLMALRRNLRATLFAV